MFGEAAQEDFAPVSRDQAVSDARHYLDRVYPPPQDSWNRDQARELALEMFLLAIAEALRNGETRQTLDQKLTFCVRLVENLKYAGRSGNIEQIYSKGESDRTNAEQNIIALRNNVVWRRYRFPESFQLGPSSSEYFDASKETLAHMAADYLSEPWARHPVVDWILLDMMITREACIYGEQIKMNGIPGLEGRSPIGFSSQYWKHNGNLSKMRGDVPSQAISWILPVLLGWIIPIAAIWAAIAFDYEKTAIVFAGLFALSTAWWLLALVIRFGTKIYWQATGKSDPSRRPLEIVLAMQEVWHELEGPVVNPTMVRSAMMDAKRLGAAWEGAAWAIIDRATAIDPAVMVTTTKAR